MDLKHLERFIEWLQNDLTHFECLVLEGSAVTKDPWQAEFSDYDLNVVVRQDPENEAKAIYKFIMNNKLGDKHLLGVIQYDNFISGDSLTDLSYKYRSKVIAGNDLIKAKQCPSRNIIYKQGVDGLEHLITRFNRRKLNLAHWSDDYSRKKNYDVLKQFFVMTAAWQYGKTGSYPVTRQEVCRILEPYGDATKILIVTNNMSSATRNEQFDAFETGVTIINNVLT